VASGHLEPRRHEPGVVAAGNGTVMRAAPIALVASDLIAARELAREDAELTHADSSRGNRLRRAVRGRDPRVSGTSAV
jgi:hypothetical protein